MKSKNILITGATGNIGHEVIRFLFENKTPNHVIAGVRNIEKARSEFKIYPQLDFVQFDFENFQTFDTALKHIDCIFLLRPPHISDTEKYFKPLISKIKEKGIDEVIFLSVQGVEKSKIIPHNKIEKLIKEQHISHIFLRPSYFMQNLTTTLINDIRIKREIILPAGKAKFNWIDVENIGEVAAIMMDRFSEYRNREIELTGTENESFYKVVELMNLIGNKTPIKFMDTNALQFYQIKQKEGMDKGMIFVMIMLHLLRRFQKEPVISNFYELLTNKKPTTLVEFIKREENKLAI